MPSPVGHAIAGLTVFTLAEGRVDLARLRFRVAVVLVAALAPDLDLAWRLLDGRNHHQMQAHSLGAAVLAGLVVLLLGWGLGWQRPRWLALAAGLAWASHVAFDYLGADTNPPIGIMALWPLDTGYHHFPWPVFMDIGRTLEWRTLRHNAAAAALESALLLPLLLLATRARRTTRG